MEVMVELEAEDFNEIFDWFTLAFAKKSAVDITKQAKKTFWKLKFLTEDKIRELEGFDD